jgi:hypothetical protein
MIVIHASLKLEDVGTWSHCKFGADPHARLALGDAVPDRACSDSQKNCSGSPLEVQGPKEEILRVFLAYKSSRHFECRLAHPPSESLPSHCLSLCTLSPITASNICVRYCARSMTDFRAQRSLYAYAPRCGYHTPLRIPRIARQAQI